MPRHLPYRFVSTAGLLALGLALVAPLQSPGQAAPPPPYDDASRYDLLDTWSETLGVGAYAVRVDKFKVRDRRSGAGAVVSSGGSKSRASPSTGKIHPNLRQRYAQTRAAEGEGAQTVIVWLNQPAAFSKQVRTVWQETEGDVEYAAEGRRTLIQKVVTKAVAAVRGYARTANQRRAEVHTACRSLVEQFLAAEQIPAARIVSRFQYGPGVALRLTESECEQLAQSDWVGYLFADEEAEKELNEIIPAIQGVSIWNAGYTGAGVTVAHIEPEPGRMETANPYLSATVYCPEGAVDSHATGIGGIIAGQKEDARGIAYGCNLLNANASSSTETALGQAVDWAITQGATILNLSYGLKTSSDGALHWSDIYFDYVVHNARVLFTKSAGNQGVGSGIVTSPARGYNSFAVGNVNGHNTVTWDDDEMSPSSSYADPITGGEKPEVATYGSSVYSTSVSPPWMKNIGSGTSFAAPLVAGIAALCTEADPTLADEPAALKAMIMVSALAHNIEGDARLSEKDGAGGAAATAVNAGSYAMTLTEADFDTNGWYVIPIDIPLESGQKKRVVLTYTHAPMSQGATPDPSSYDACDLDMSLTIGGSTVASSAYGLQNPFEIIDYVHPSADTAHVRLTKFSWDPDISSLRIGLAWASASTVGEGPDEVAFDPTASKILLFVLLLLLLIPGP